MQNFLKKYYSDSDIIILACSCGPDSMYLLYELLKTTYKNNLVVCYFNHKLRVEADEEENYIENLGKELGFKVEIGSTDIKAIHEKIPSKSIEEIAREKRYAFFNAILNIYDSEYILTAHHLDDKIETFFFNLLRGSKITGLINMTEKNGAILRPLLNIQKNEIIEYLNKNNITYFQDITNLDSDISRNFLRLEIIPKLGKINSNYKANLNNFMNYLANFKNHLDSQVIEFLEKNSDLDLNYQGKLEKNFKISTFNGISQFLQNEVIRYIFFIRNGNSTIGLSESNIAEIIRFINGKNNKTIKEIKNLKLFKNGKLIYY